MVKSFDCIKCGEFHPRPINRNCKEQKAEEVQMDTNVQILHELKNLSSRMTKMEDKVQRMDDIRSPARSTTTNSSTTRADDVEEDLVLPSISNYFYCKHQREYRQRSTPGSESYKRSQIKASTSHKEVAVKLFL